MTQSFNLRILQSSHHLIEAKKLLIKSALHLLKESPEKEQYRDRSNFWFGVSAIYSTTYVAKQC